MQIKNIRFLVAAITTFSAYAVYVSRVNLSIAIIAMVEHNHNHTESQVNSVLNGSQIVSDLSQPTGLGLQQQSNLSPSTVHGNNGNISANLVPQPTTTVNNKTLRAHLTTTFLTPEKPVKTPLISQEKFHWDQTEQGHILGAFFYGYILFQIPGARISESVGAKWIIMAASAGSAVISLVFPLSTQLNSIHLLMALRFVMGLCQSAFFPAAYVLFCRWLPERERSVLLPIMFVGSNMGSISAYIMSSYLISANYGWPSIFYLSGLICLIVSILWYVIGSNGPDDNWWISDKERRFIEYNVNNQSSENASLNEQSLSSSNDDMKEKLDLNNNNSNQILVNSENKSKKNISSSALNKQGKLSWDPPEPSWPKLLKSVPIWTLILSMYGNEWSNVVICYELPTYLNSALTIPIEQNGVINSFFQLSYAVASPIMSSLGSYMLDRHLLGMRKIHVRRLFQSLATFGQLACFVSVPICGSNRGLIIMFMFAAIVLKACANAGDIMVSGDLSPEYAGTIFAFANSIGNTAGFFVPLLAGVFVSDANQREQWTPFWLTTAAIMGCSGLIFLIFGETRRQDFSLDIVELPELEEGNKKSNSTNNKEANRKIGTTLV